jgi:hypothetical protein
VIRRVLYLIGGSLACWLLTVLLAWTVGGGNVAVAYSGTAILLCLLPAVGTLTWAEWTRSRDPEQFAIAVLGGTAVRMLFVLGIGLLLNLTVPYFQETSFWIWVLGAYLFTLALELALILAGKPAGPPGLEIPHANSVDNVKS